MVYGSTITAVVTLLISTANHRAQDIPPLITPPINPVPYILAE